MLMKPDTLSQVIKVSINSDKSLIQYDMMEMTLYVFGLSLEIPYLTMR